MDVEDILARSSNTSQWDCSSMLPNNEEGQDEYSSVRAKFHYVKPILLCHVSLYYFVERKQLRSITGPASRPTESTQPSIPDGCGLHAVTVAVPDLREGMVPAARRL